MKKTRDVTKNCNVEILLRDVYTTNGDRARLRKWVDMTKKIFQI
jgi:arsenate reductase-like glutaredoxin family protein